MCTVPVKVNCKYCVNKYQGRWLSYVSQFNIFVFYGWTLSYVDWIVEDGFLVTTTRVVSKWLVIYGHQTFDATLERKVYPGNRTLDLAHRSIHSYRSATVDVLET